MPATSRVIHQPITETLTQQATRQTTYIKAINDCNTVYTVIQINNLQTY